jgi:hypothetical protein
MPRFETATSTSPFNTGVAISSEKMRGGRIESQEINVQNEFSLNDRHVLFRYFCLKFKAFYTELSSFFCLM